jgi:subfamily B ATP-binding cassette protein MsbA
MQFYLRAISYFRADLVKIITALVIIAVMILSGLLQLYPIQILVDSVFGPHGPTNGIARWFFRIAPEGKVQQIIVLAAFVLGLRLLQELLSMGYTLLNIQIGYNGLMRVRCDLFQKLQALSLAYHRSQPQGDAIYRLSYDTSGFQTILNTIVQTVLVSSITLIFMVWIMLSMNWRLTLLSLAVAPLLFWTTKLYSKVLQKKATEAKEVEAQLTTTIQRSAATIGLVQAFNREADEYEKFSTSVQASVSAYLRLHWQEMLFWLLVGNIFGVGGALIFGYGGYIVYQDQYVRHLGDAGLTVGELTIFLGYVGMLYAPLKNLSGSGAAMASGIAGVRRVFEVMDRDPVIKDAPNAVQLPVRPRALALDHVVFEYQPGRPVLNDVSCVIAPGQMVAFVGQSGVGKTTLLNLLPRFYDPVKGALKLDEYDLRQIRVKDVRSHIALVLQETVILPTTVRENIAYGRPHATDAQIRNAAEISGAAVFINQLPGKYEEVITESGQNLSGGQKQRISIARALLTEAPIIIMDEPTSALDAQHEEQIIATLRRLRGKGGRTIILVSHRLSTVADCDRIFVMHEGKIVERGTHDELVAQRGHYYEMARHQMRLGEAV